MSGWARVYDRDWDSGRSQGLALAESIAVIGTTLNQRFVLEKELGRGGMGAVYRATDQILQRTVAIKILKDLGGEEVGRRLCLEAQILARLLHDNIVRLYDFNQNDGTYYFIMEEVDGTSFHKRWKRVTLPERLRMLAQTADALDYAHRQGVIHRDVKPANILLTSTDQAKLSDFGLSVQMGESQESGVVRGTPHYMSPEQARGKRLDHRTDLYSLGVLLYECATGTPPFQGSSLEIMSHHVHAEVEPPRARTPGINPDLDELILELLAKAPDARPGSGREVAERLRALAIGAANNASPTADAGEPGAPSGSFLTTQAQPGVLPPTVAALPATPSRTASRSDANPAQTMIEAVEADPIPLSPAERYLAGHYLAYLLGGSRRRGFLLRRPLDPLNADRARLLLALTYLSVAGTSDETINRAAALLDSRIDVRPSLSPIVVAKYLLGRDSPGKRRKFRQTRQQLQQASTYAQNHLTDPQGVLNPGLMPQVLDDLKKIAPSMSEVNDQLVQRWNRVAEVWRGNPAFRDAVLRYATTGAWRDPNSGLLWPEVVYPLIERARWQRRARSSYEALRDAVFAPLHLPDAGNRLDQVIKRTVPQQVVEQLDDELSGFLEDPGIEDEPDAEPSPQLTTRPSHSSIRAESFEDLGNDEPEPSGLVRLTSPDPVRLTQGDLGLLWKESIAALRDPKAQAAQRSIPVGPYRIAVVASIRSRAAGQVVIQGMPNKQLELLVPSFSSGGSATKPVIAAWVYTNNSLAVTYNDHQGVQRYILWNAPTSQQTNFADPADLNHALYQLGLETPDQLSRALSKKFRPTNPV